MLSFCESIFIFLALVTFMQCKVCGHRISLVTFGTIEQSVMLLRSATHFCTECFDIHLCILNTHNNRTIDQILSSSEIIVHLLHHVLNADGTMGWNNLVCMSQVSDHYFLRGIPDVTVVFIGANFIISSNLYPILTGSVLRSKHTIWCAPKLSPKYPADLLSGGMCEMDIMVMSTEFGTSFYASLNATSYLNLTAENALEAAASSLSLDIRILPIAPFVVRAGHMWYGRDDGQDVILLEVDGYNHVVRPIPELCTLYVHVEWPLVYNTANVISNIFRRIDNDAQTLSILSGCSNIIANAWNAKTVTKRADDSDVRGNSLGGRQRVFDSIMLNDELPLLRLRLEYLSAFVDTFIVIESRRTFTGKIKPLYYAENKHLFAEFVDRILHVEVALPFEKITLNKQVWLNEYYSRNAVADALEFAQASDDDIILLNDIDEIPHPRAISSLRALFSQTAALSLRNNNHSSNSNNAHQEDERSNYATHDDRIYKLFTHTYMYNFSCSMHPGGLLSAGAPAATTLGISKKLGTKHAAQVFADPTSPAAIMHGIEKHHITLTRLYQQTTQPYPLRNVLNPGGWHLTFFGGVHKIKRKLESYSHQNFVSQFIPTVEAPIAQVLQGGLSTSTCIDGDECGITAAPGDSTHESGVVNNLFPVEFITEEMSIDLIAERVAKGRTIDHRSAQRCRAVSAQNIDTDTEMVQILWNNIVLSEKYDV